MKNLSLRAIDIEAHAWSSLAAIDAVTDILPTASPPENRAQTALRWTTIFVLLAAAGLGTIACFSTAVNGLT